MQSKAHIIGLGAFLPDKVLNNADLEALVDTSDEWIVSRTGIKERRIASEKECTSYMGARASQRAIDSAGIDPATIDLIVLSTCTPDYMGTNSAAAIQSKLGLAQVPAVDIQAACSGYLYGLSVAKAYVESGMYKNVLLVASEKMSSFIDFTDRNSCILFGDGACAAVVSSEKRGLAIDCVCLGADGDNSEIVYVPAGGVCKPASHESVEARDHYFKLKGREVYKHAIRRMSAVIEQCLEKTHLKQEQISWLVPHQANLRIIESLANSFDMPLEKVYLTISKYGNTSASSVGIALSELMEENPVEPGEHILLTAFGAGLTWGGAVLTKTKE